MTAPRWLIPVSLVAVFGGFAGYRWSPWRESPRQAWDAISAAAAAGDYGAVYDRFDPESRNRMAPLIRGFAETAAPDRAAGMTDRERFALHVERHPDVRAQFLPGKVLDVEVVGDRALVRLDRPDPLDSSPVPATISVVLLAWNDGRWCLTYGADPPE